MVNTVQLNLYYGVHWILIEGNKSRIEKSQRA
ncbi:uncharacterized protein METZ01_LOCUS145724 [marine metagenome]|uniref:Uncharacterized protein n=1 Tax=marine metagenome TaxID=408172 RepID=A0A381ZUF9_9ZZZZ